MSKKIITIIIIIMIAALGCWVYQSMMIPEPEELIKKEQACVNSGGEVSTSLCCETTGDFPNLCSIGPCTCALGYSHKVKICDCGSDKCFNGSECVSLDEISKDEISVLLENLKQETRIDFSEIQPLEFKWVVKVDPKVEEVDIKGKGFEVRGIPAEQELKVTKFLTNDGFEKDLYNMADGTVAGLVGYKKDQIVCTVTSGASGYKEATGQWVPPDWDKKDIDIKCGKLEMIIDPVADWNSYASEKYGYSFKYPTDCLYGPLPGYCKQKPPEERSRECRCYLNGENPDSVSLGTFTGTKSDILLILIILLPVRNLLAGLKKNFLIKKFQMR